MSEEGQEPTITEVEDESVEEVTTSLANVDDPATLKKMIKSLRAENASSRQKKNAVETELTEFRKWKESQMSELERAKADNENMSKKYRQVLVDKLAIEFGVDDDFKEFIVGDSEDEMVERAKKLGSRKGGDNSDDDSPLKARLLGGNRGTSVGKRTDGSNRVASSDSEGNWFKALYDNK